MPSTSAAQSRFMAMCSTDKGRAKASGKCPPKAVALEFRHADKGKHFTSKSNQHGHRMMKESGYRRK